MRLKPVRRTPSPFEPFATIISALFTLVIAWLAFAAITFALGDENTGIGESIVCAEDMYGTYGVREDRMPPQVRPEVEVASKWPVQLCDPVPGLGERTLDAVAQIPMLVIYLGAMFLLWRLVRGAAGAGPFSRVNVRRVRFIGWWLLGGGTIANLIEYGAETWLVFLMYLPGQQPDFWLDVTRLVPWVLVLAGVGLLTVARILEVGVRMHEDLEGTV